jgi:regulator of CtrA degradation
MTDAPHSGSGLAAAPLTLTDAGSEAAITRRLMDFARSELFDKTFAEGMRLVEETAAYLDGPGRAASKRLSRTAALAYATESMRLTTRLMQVASWLLVQRAVRDSEITIGEARQDKYRLASRAKPDEAPVIGADDLPEDLTSLMRRAASLNERVRRLDLTMYEAEPAPENAVAGHMARLNAVFGAPK